MEHPLPHGSCEGIGCLRRAADLVGPDVMKKAADWAENSARMTMPPLAHFGMIIVPVGYGDPVTFRAGTPYGASSVSGQNAAPPTDDDGEVARYQGKRTAQVVAALKAARST